MPREPERLPRYYCVREVLTWAIRDRARSHRLVSRHEALTDATKICNALNKGAK